MKDICGNAAVPCDPESEPRFPMKKPSWELLRSPGENERKCWMTRRQVAGHFQVSPRTITNFVGNRIFPFHRLENLVRFEADECDRAFEKFKCASVLKVKISVGCDRGRTKQWKTKTQIARHFHFCYRTVGNLMRLRLLPFVKLGNVVRFDLLECERIMERQKTPSIYER